MNTAILDKNNLILKKTVRNWYDAIPLGNGMCGALIWGGPDALKFSLDRIDLWDITPTHETLAEDYTYPELIRLVREKNDEDRLRRFSNANRHPTPLKIPAGRLQFDFGCDGEVRSELILKNAEARVTLGEGVEIRSFMDANRRLGMIRINRPASAFSLELGRPDFGVEGEDLPPEGYAGSALRDLVYPAACFTESGNARRMIQQIGGKSYGVFAETRAYEAHTEIAFTVSLSTDGENWADAAAGSLTEALALGYDALLTGHAAWWACYWEKSSLSVPDARFEKNWYLTQYYFASTSRKGGYPMPLQGVWTQPEERRAVCSGDYHYDLNVQMSYYHYLKANRIEEGEVLIDYLWSLVDTARDFARDFYKSRGLCLPSMATIEGKAFGGWDGPALSPTHQLWTCQLLERHFRATGDMNLLRERVYPYMKEVAECILGIAELKDGKYYLPISTSPEIHDNRIESFVTPNSNYDLSLMIYAFQTLKRLAALLGNGEEDRWQQELDRLPELAINEKGVLMISPDEELQESHRHHSHAMAIHPLRLLDCDKQEDRRVIDATVKDLERLGSGHWMVFGLVWMAEFNAIQGNGNGAAHQLEMFWRYYCSRSGFSLNNDVGMSGNCTSHGACCTIETNFSAADALQEMLLQSENNVLRLFYAIPEEWEEETVSFNTFRAENGLLVSAVCENGRVTSLTLQPERSCEVSVVKTARTAELLAGLPTEDGCAKLTLTAGQPVALTL